MPSGFDDPYPGARRPGPGDSRPAGPSASDPRRPARLPRNRAAQAWSELDEQGDGRTAVMPGFPEPAAPPFGSGPGPVISPGPTAAPGPRRPAGQPRPVGPLPHSARPASGPLGAPGRPSQPPPQAPRRPAAAAYPPPRRRTPGGIIAARIIAAVLSLAVIAVVGFYKIFLNNTNAKVADSDVISSVNSQNNTQAGGNGGGVVFSGGVNILLVGSDARTDADGNPLTAAQLKAVGTQDDGGSINTDTIIIVHIPQGGGKATAVSIPRDTYIPADVADQVKGPYDDGTYGTYKPNKINSYYGTAAFYDDAALQKKGVAAGAARTKQAAEAGRVMLTSIVERFTGLKIDHYAEVNLIGFYTLSEAIGGVPVCLNEAVDDPYSGAKFKAGEQQVEGSTAMAFVRQRHGLPGGDLDRVRRQQAFLAGATTKMMSAGVLTSPSKLNALADAAGKSLTLDKGFDLLTFASQMQNLSGGNVTFTTIPTHGDAAASGTDALATDPAELKTFFAKLSGGSTAATTTSRSTAATSAADASVDPSAVTVDVQDATSAHASGDALRDKLQRDGYQPGQSVDFDGVRASTTIAYPAGAKQAAVAVQKALGGGAVIQSSSVEKGHVLIVVGNDLAGSALRGQGAAFAAVTGSTGGSTTTGTKPTKAGSVITADGVQCVN